MSEVIEPVPETPAQQVARRIRGRLAEERISGRRMALMIGMDQNAFSRRNRGLVDWQIDEIAAIAGALGVPFEDLCRIEDGGGWWRARRDSNPQPSDLVSGLRAVPALDREIAPVTALSDWRSSRAS